MQERKGRKASPGGEKSRAYRSLTQAARAARKAAGDWVGKTAGNWKTKMGNVEKTNKARHGSAGTVQNKRRSKVKSRNLLERKHNWRKCAANLLMKEMAGLRQKIGRWWESCLSGKEQEAFWLPRALTALMQAGPLVMFLVEDAGSYGCFWLFFSLLKSHARAVSFFSR